MTTCPNPWHPAGPNHPPSASDVPARVARRRRNAWGCPCPADAGEPPRRTLLDRWLGRWPGRFCVELDSTLLRRMTTEPLVWPDSVPIVGVPHLPPDVAEDDASFAYHAEARGVAELLGARANRAGVVEVVTYAAPFPLYQQLSPDFRRTPDGAMRLVALISQGAARSVGSGL